MDALLRLLCILLLSTPSSSCDGIKSRLVEGFATEEAFVGLLMVSFESRCLSSNTFRHRRQPWSVWLLANQKPKIISQKDTLIFPPYTTPTTSLVSYVRSKEDHRPKKQLSGEFLDTNDANGHFFVSNTLPPLHHCLPATPHPQPLSVSAFCMTPEP
jgi:hypothetical protein